MFNQTVKLILADDEATQQLGAKLVASLNAEDANCVIALNGPLGVGKTSLTKGIGAALGIKEVVVSPTFTMINEYTSGRVPLYHLDLYRLQESIIGGDDVGSEAEGKESGGRGSAGNSETGFLISQIEELRTLPGIIVVEWAYYLREYFMVIDHVDISLEYTNVENRVDSVSDFATQDKRAAHLTAHGVYSAGIVESISNVYFS